MALFEFTLKNLEKTLELNSGSDGSISWDWLTDGSYNIHLAGRRLFTFNPDLQKKETVENLQAYLQQCVDNGLPPDEPDYHIMRLHRDVLENVLPYVKHNVSPVVHQLLMNSKALNYLRNAWDNALSNALEMAEFNPEMEQAVWENYNIYSQTAQCGNLGNGYMVLPETRVWRFNDKVYIYWNGTAIDSDSNLPWFKDHQEAVFEIAADKFINEVKDFHNRLMDAMSERVQALEGHASFMDIFREHGDNFQALAQALEAEPAIHPATDFVAANAKAGIDLQKVLQAHPVNLEVIAA